jgi:hypothetical protein
MQGAAAAAAAAAMLTSTVCFFILLLLQLPSKVFITQGLCRQLLLRALLGRGPACIQYMTHDGSTQRGGILPVNDSF